MKKMVSMVLCLVLCFYCLSSTVLAADEVEESEVFLPTEELYPQLTALVEADTALSATATTTYWFQMAENRSSGYISEFWVQQNGLLPIRRIYAQAGFQFADGVKRTVTVEIDGNYFYVVADGQIHSLGNWFTNTGSVVTITISGISSLCACVVSVYSIDT